MQRRSVLTGSGAVIALGISGCLDDLDDGGNGDSGDDGFGGLTSSGPDPRVEDVESDQSLTGALSGTVDIYVLVSNSGDDGDVEVTVTVLDSAGNTLDRTRRVVHVENGENRRVDMTIDTPDGADRFNAEADAA